MAQTAEYVMRSDVIPEETADDSPKSDKWKVQFCIFSTMHYNNASYLNEVLPSVISFRFGSENYFAFNLPSTLVTSGLALFTLLLTSLHRDFNKGRHPAICRRFKRVKSPVRLLETKIFVH